jgi:hypothetical protein
MSSKKYLHILIPVFLLLSNVFNQDSLRVISFAFKFSLRPFFILESILAFLYTASCLLSTEIFIQIIDYSALDHLVLFKPLFDSLIMLLFRHIRNLLYASLRSF